MKSSFNIWNIKYRSSKLF